MDADDVPLMPADKLIEIFRLLPLIDSVELKATVPDADRLTVLGKLGIDPLDAQMRQVAFFDTPDLTLNKAGVVLRARRVQADRGDSVVKLRPATAESIPAADDRPEGYGVEVDAMPGGFVCSSTVKRSLKDERLKPVFAGDQPLSTLFNKEQRAVFGANAPGHITLDDVLLLGPITLLKLKFRPDGLDRKLVAELWFYPDGSRILELSTKCAPIETLEAAQETRAYLEGRGVDLGAPQQTKTASALRYFAAEATASTA